MHDEWTRLALSEAQLPEDSLAAICVGLHVEASLSTGI